MGSVARYLVNHCGFYENIGDSNIQLVGYIYRPVSKQVIKSYCGRHRQSVVATFAGRQATDRPWFKLPFLSLNLGAWPSCPAWVAGCSAKSDRDGRVALQDCPVEHVLPCTTSHAAHDPERSADSFCCSRLPRSVARQTFTPCTYLSRYDVCRQAAREPAAACGGVCGMSLKPCDWSDSSSTDSACILPLELPLRFNLWPQHSPGPLSYSPSSISET